MQFRVWLNSQRARVLRTFAGTFSSTKARIFYPYSTPSSASIIHFIRQGRLSHGGELSTDSLQVMRNLQPLRSASGVLQDGIYATNTLEASSVTIRKNQEAYLLSKSGFSNWHYSNGTST